MDVLVELNERVSRMRDDIIKKSRRDRREQDQHGIRMAGRTGIKIRLR